MAEQVNRQLQSLTPEEIEREINGSWGHFNEMLAQAEGRELVVDGQNAPAMSDKGGEGIAHTATVVAKQLGSAALFPGRAYWNVIKWGINHVR